MNAAVYEQILEKLLNERGTEGVLQLFNKDIYAYFPTQGLTERDYERYRYLYSFILSNINLVVTLAEGTHKEELLLVKGFIDRLDAYECIDHLTAEMSKEVFHSILQKITKQKEEFVATLREVIKAVGDKEETLMFVVAFGKIIYTNCEFQAPLRSDPRLAALDSQGMTDHYSELIDEILKPEVIVTVEKIHTYLKDMTSARLYKFAMEQIKDVVTEGKRFVVIQYESVDDILTKLETDGDVHVEIAAHTLEEGGASLTHCNYTKFLQAAHNDDSLVLVTITFKHKGDVERLTVFKIRV